MTMILTRRDVLPLAASFVADCGKAFAAQAPLPFVYSGPERQAFLEKGARAEGTLTFYSSLIPNLGLKAIVDGFQKKYPFIAVNSWRGTEINIAQKTLAEL